MTRYQVNGFSAGFASGVLELTRAQAEPRLAQLGGKLHDKHTSARAKPETRAPYPVHAPVEFKSGEVIGYDGDVPKMWLATERLIDLDAVEASKIAAAEAETRREAERAANALAAQETDELIAAMQGITGDAKGNIDANELAKLLEGRINFKPTDEQLAAAWAVHVERLTKD